MLRNLISTSKILSRNFNSFKLFGGNIRYNSGIPIFPNEEAICKNLSSFPEFLAGFEEEKKKNYKASLTQYNRIYDICLNILDKSNDMTFYILFKIICLNAYCGNYKEAIKLLESYNRLIPKDDKKFSLISLFSNQFLSYLSFSTHNYEKALEFSLIAVDILENDSNLDISLFSSVYSLAGISYLSNNNTEEAETYFQLASRWAMNPHEVLSSLTNLASLPLYELSFSGDFNWWNYSVQSTLRTQSLASKLSSSVSGKFDNNDPLIAPLLNNPQIVKTLEEVVDKYISALTEAKGSSEVMTPSVCVSHAPKAKTIKSFEEDDELQQMLKSDPLFSLSYAKTLCNIAELKHLIQSLPSFTGEIQKNDTPSYYLSNALKVISFHQDIQNSESMTAKFRSNSLLYEQGRIIRLIAANHLSLGQGVTAEGLIRSSLDSFKDTRVDHDFR